MSRRSKREVAPPPQGLPSSPASFDWTAAAPPPVASGLSLFAASQASMQTTPGSVAPNPWWGWPPLPHQATPSSAAACAWWSGGGAGPSHPNMVQKRSLGSDLQELEVNPPGGFMGLLNNTSDRPLPQQIPPVSISKSSLKSKTLIDLDNGDDDGDGARTDRRLQWTKDEEERLVSAWLNNSNDPINGNCKKSDRYWGDVTNEYNNTTPNSRRRTSKQLKDHFQKIKRKVGWFCSSWKEATSIYASGQSDDQLMDKAQKIYEQYKDGLFTLKHCWMILRDEPKWQAILEETMMPNKRKLDDGEMVEHVPAPTLSDDRPIGNKKAKAERNGKGKAYPSHMDDVLKKLTEIQGTDKSRNELLETQKRVSSEKLESARLNHLAAKENAKSAMLETYRTLILKETSGMPDDVKAEHVMFLKCIRESIFGKTIEVAIEYHDACSLLVRC